VIPDVSKGSNSLVLKGEVLPEKENFRDLLTPSDAPKSIIMNTSSSQPIYNLTGKYTFERNN
jgi:hypothetical protein